MHAEKQEKIRMREESELLPDDAASGSFGTQVKHVPMAHIPYKPPGYNTRYVGKTPITPHVEPQGNTFQPNGGRRDEIWVHQGISHSRIKVFDEPYSGVFTEEDDLPDSSPQRAGGAAAPCELTCEPMEFFCSKSCSCIGSELRCGMNDFWLS
jgi:hypothetical protein